MSFFLSFFLRKDFLFKNGYALAVKKGFGIVFFSPHQDFLLRCSRALTFGSVVFSLSFFLHKTILLLKNSHVVSTQKASPVASLSLHKHSLIQKKGDVRTCSKAFSSVFLPSFLPFFGPSFFLFLFLLLFVCCCFSLTGDRAYQSHSSAIDELISAAQPMRSSQCSEEAAFLPSSPDAAQCQACWRRARRRAEDTDRAVMGDERTYVT